ncbi:MAG: DUF1634 domain-containing protein [bacterium]|nr:MAG: DUF1634 domain-containing protein [Fervidicoccus sp.]
MEKIRNERFELILSYVLLIGVSLSALLIFIGIILSYLHHLPVQRDVLSLLKQGAHYKGYLILALGFILLLATPIMRVIFSMFLFLLYKDWTYVLISLLVLIILITSIVLGGLGGKAVGP